MLENVDDIFKGTAVQKLFFVCIGGRDKRRSWLGFIVHSLRWYVLVWPWVLLRKILEVLNSSRKEQRFRLWDNLLNLFFFFFFPGGFMGGCLFCLSSLYAQHGV